MGNPIDRGVSFSPALMSSGLGNAPAVQAPPVCLSVCLPPGFSLCLLLSARTHIHAPSRKAMGGRRCDLFCTERSGSPSRCVCASQLPELGHVPLQLQGSLGSCVVTGHKQTRGSLGKKEGRQRLRSPMRIGACRLDQICHHPKDGDPVLLSPVPSRHGAWHTEGA